MNVIRFLSIVSLNLILISVSAQKNTIVDEKLIYHPIHLSSDQTILPWYSDDLGKSYDFVVNATWDFWKNMRIDKNGLPYYMNHQVWRENYNDRRGIGGDQLSMALSSFNLYYGYSGDEAVKEEMKFIAGYYLSHSLSPSDAVWPDIPYPYNTLIYSGIFDGDMVIGKDFTQPDKAGSFGLELVKMYKMIATFPHPNITAQSYLDAAIKIANTLSMHIKSGDNDNSPLPFKVNAISGEVGVLKSNSGSGMVDQFSSYTTNWVGTMEMFLHLIDLKAGDVDKYQQAFTSLLDWMKNYPLKTNKWGPFFEDIPGWSDTQINAITFARFMMNHQEYFPNWKVEVEGIFDWVYETLGNNEWENYGVVVVNEQTAYQTPGNSHTSRQAAAELQYVSLTGDLSRKQNAILQLNWATYMVDTDGKNCYPRDEIWLTDGYGDYIRHYLRAIEVMPELSVNSENHILSSTSIIQLASYPPEINKILSLDVPENLVDKTMIFYKTFDNHSTEKIRLIQKPSSVLLNLKPITENSSSNDSWTWTPMNKGGLLTVNHSSGNHVIILK